MFTISLYVPLYSKRRLIIIAKEKKEKKTQNKIKSICGSLFSKLNNVIVLNAWRHPYKLDKTIKNSGSLNEIHKTNR